MNPLHNLQSRQSSTPAESTPDVTSTTWFHTVIPIGCAIIAFIVVFSYLKHRKNRINHAASRIPVFPIYPTGRGPAQPPPVYSPPQPTQEELWEDQRFARAMENWRKRYESRWQYENSGGFNGVPSSCAPPDRQHPDSWNRYL